VVEMQVESLGLDRSTKAPVVILRAKEGSQILPIWIGPAEASAIAMHLASIPFSRPLTHDLMLGLLRELGGALVQVEITAVEDATYFASLVIQREGILEPLRLDTRPSDGIALAIRVGAPILAEEDLLDAVDVELAEGGPESEGEGGGAASSEPEPLSPEALSEYLRRMNPEDFGRFTP
jgi:uncharacterized protein